jgi:hypothetical protein
MPSTYSSNLRLELIATGEQQGTWGSTTNNNLGTLLEQAIGGYVNVSVSDIADTTLTSLNGLSDQSRNVVINLIGSISASRNVICPAIQKLYVVKNATTGGFAVTFKVSGQTGVSIPNGTTLFVYVDGTDVRAITGSLASQAASNVAITGGSITGITDLAIADGGTGASTAANARTNLGLAIGTNVQAYDPTLQSLSALGTAADRYAYTTGVDTWVEGTITSAGRALLDDADASAQRTTLGLGNLATLNTVGTSQIDNNSVNGAKIALGSDAQGDVMYYNGTDWARLAAGSSGQLLKTNGSGANPEWDSSVVRGTAITTVGGTSHSFTNIPSWVKRITFILKGVSTNSTSELVIRAGTGGVVQNSGYTSTVMRLANAATPASLTDTTGVLLDNATLAADLMSGSIVFHNITGNDWVVTGLLKDAGTTAFIINSEFTLSGALDITQITTFGGTASFDAGTVNIMYE